MTTTDAAPRSHHAEKQRPRCTTQAIIRALHSDAKWEIRGRHGRRLGQHGVEVDTKALGIESPRKQATIGVDVLMRHLRAANMDARYLVQIQPKFPDLDEILKRHSTSPVVVQYATNEGLWLLDRDQIAALLGQGWSPPHREQRSELCCGEWRPIRYRMTPGPFEEPDDDDWMRKTLDKLKNYGHTAAETSAQEGRHAVRPSKGDGTGRPGIELSKETLANWREELVGQGVPGARSLHFNGWVAARRTFNSATGPAELTIPVTLRKAPRDAQRKDHQVGVDQVIRLALGVANGEHVQLSPIQHEHRHSRRRRLWRPWRLTRPPRRLGAWLLRVLLPAVNVVARVQPAELTLTEQNACLLSPLALDSLGLKSGDEIRIHAASHRPPTWNRLSTKVRRRLGMPTESADPQLHHAQMVLKAYVAPDDVRDRRMQAYGGSRGSPLPSEEEALHTPQQLPWIWLDEAVRLRLGLPTTLGAVIVQPSRRFVIADHLTEVAILASIGLAGAFASLDSLDSLDWSRFLAVTGAVMALPLLLLFWRVRTRLR